MSPTHRASGRRRSVLRALALLATVGGAATLIGCGGGEASAARFCADVGQVPVISSADQLQGTGGQAALTDLRSALDHLRGRAPDPVADDVATLSRVTGQLQDALREQDAGDQDAVDRARGDLDASLSTFEAASARVVAYSQQTCGLDIGRGAANATAAATGAPTTETTGGDPTGTSATGGEGSPADATTTTSP